MYPACLFAGFSSKGFKYSSPEKDMPSGAHTQIVLTQPHIRIILTILVILVPNLRSTYILASLKIMTS